MEVLAIVGPTGTGKSQLALDIAHLVGAGCEVINADAFSLYQGMDVGTAKVLPQERQDVPHHLIDILHPLEIATIAEYQEQGLAAIEQVIAKGHLPIVVGGSGLYVRALLDGFDLPGTDPALRAKLNAELEEHGTETMYQRLVQVDPQAAAQIGARNGRRIVRALEVIHLTGKPFTAQLPAPKYRRDTVTIGLDFNREQLDHRIEQRVANMRENGLLDEVKRLASPEQGGEGAGLGPTAIRAVGYYELLPVLRGEASAEAAFADVVTHTRQLTRKQMGWFGRDHRIKWFGGGEPNLASIVVNYLENPDPTPPQPPLEPIRTPLGSVAG